MENRFIINIIFQEPYIGEDRLLHVATRATTLPFKTLKAAKEKYDEVTRSHNYQQDTVAGKLSFLVISTELVDRQKYAKYLEEQEALNEQHGNSDSGIASDGTGESTTDTGESSSEASGEIEDANDENFSSEEESSFKQTI